MCAETAWRGPIVVRRPATEVDLAGKLYLLRLGQERFPTQGH
jgi:hypothetical protein